MAVLVAVEEEVVVLGAQGLEGLHEEIVPNGNLVVNDRVLVLFEEAAVVQLQAVGQ